MSEIPETTASDILVLTARIVSAHVGNNSVPADALPDLIVTVRKALIGVGAIRVTQPMIQQRQPAVSARKSVQPNHLICLEDGNKVIMLKRYLQRCFGLTPNEYRAKWGLPADYPMVAPNYAARRSALAKQLGLGRKREVPNTGVSGMDGETPAKDTGSTEEHLFPADLADEAQATRHTAESVFGSFGPGDTEPAETVGHEDVAAAEAPPRKRGRKPFAEQSVRAIRKGPALAKS